LLINDFEGGLVESEKKNTFNNVVIKRQTPEQRKKAQAKKREFLEEWRKKMDQLNRGTGD
jgi:Spy/CpxP family protein refolding chaperone